MATIEPEVLQVLHDLNPWWRRPGVVRPEPPPYERQPVREITERLLRVGRLVEVLRGPRQVGKTTAIYQIVKRLMAVRVRPADILFVRFDHQLLRETAGGIATITRWFSARMRRRPFTEDQPAYIFLDEVHKLRRWDEQVKHLVDTFPVRVLLTGSSSVLVSKGGRESLAGRTLTTDFPTFLFREVLESWHPRLAAILPEKRHVRSYFDPSAAAEQSEGLKLQSQQRLALKRALERYYNRGGYPRLHSGEVPDDRWADYLVETVFDRVLGVDIPDLFPVEQPALMRHIYLAVAKSTGQEIAQNRLAEDANVSGFNTNQPTVGKYVHYLADALLVREFRRYPLARRASSRVPAKITLTDLGVRNAILRGAPSLWESSPDVVGPLVETLAQTVIRGSNLQVHYYRDYENPKDRRSPIREVDFVVEETDGTVLPIEIKFRRQIDRADFRGLDGFITRFKSPCGVLVTRDSTGWDPRLRILCIPLLDFLVRIST